MRSGHPPAVPVGRRVDTEEDDAGGPGSRSRWRERQRIDLARCHMTTQGHRERAARPCLVLPRVDAARVRRDLVVGQGRADTVGGERLALGVVDLDGHVAAVWELPG